MSMNNRVKEFLESMKGKLWGIKKEDLQVKQKLSDLKNPDDWPQFPCITCKWWVAVSQELHLGECRVSAPRRGLKNPEIPDFPMTPPNAFCRQHWQHGNDDLTHRPLPPRK
jgi:hypothetical protein